MLFSYNKPIGSASYNYLLFKIIYYSLIITHLLSFYQENCMDLIYNNYLMQRQQEEYFFERNTPPVLRHKEVYLEHSFNFIIPTKIFLVLQCFSVQIPIIYFRGQKYLGLRPYTPLIFWLYQ